jgi:integrase
MRYPRRKLTDRFIESRKPAKSGDRDEYPDTIKTPMELRVTEKGAKSFVLLTRFPGSRNPTRRSLGRYGEITLAAARDKAEAWLKLLEQGKDPEIEEARQQAAQRRHDDATWAAAVAKYLAGPGGKLAKVAEARAVLERDLGKLWGKRPIGDVDPLEITEAVEAIAARAPAHAHNALGYIKQFYSWAVGTGRLRVSPADGIRPAKVIGKKKVRDRTLDDDELRLVWAAAGELGDPYCSLVRLLMVTGQRRDEIGEASWPEIRPAGWREDPKAWVSLVIPPSRMKMDAGHIVPLVPMAVDLLRPIQAGEAGQFIFTTTAGKKPVNGYSKAKMRLDKVIAKARAEARAGEGAKVKPSDFLPHWILHDLRRTMRTRMSGLPIEQHVREMVIAHSKKGITKAYDWHAYDTEKRGAMLLWANKLRDIVEPPPANVSPISKARGTQRAISR